MAGAVKVLEVDQEEFMGPATVARSEVKIEMGVRYEAGVPSPMEGAYHHEPIVVDGLVAKTGGSALGCPVQYIKLSAWCVLAQICSLLSVPCAHSPWVRAALPIARDPTPVECKYSGMRFVSKSALDYVAKHGK